MRLLIISDGTGKSHPIRFCDEAEAELIEASYAEQNQAVSQHHLWRFRAIDGKDDEAREQVEQHFDTRIPLSVPFWIRSRYMHTTRNYASLRCDAYQIEMGQFFKNYGT